MADHDLTFLHGSHTPACTARVNKHFVGYFTIQYMCAGGVEVWYDDTRQAMEGSWFWPAYHGPHIRFHPLPKYGAWNHRYVAFQGPLVSRWFATGLYPRGPQVAPRGRAHMQAFDQMLEWSHRTDIWSRRRAANLLEALLLELAQARPAPQAASATFIEKTTSQLGPELWHGDYARLAAQLGMGLSTLRRRFRDSAGLSLHSYVLQHRLTEARRLLGETDLPIKTIARQLGYRDVYFFSKQFRLKVGVPAGQYRRSRQR